MVPPVFEILRLTLASLHSKAGLDPGNQENRFITMRMKIFFFDFDLL